MVTETFFSFPSYPTHEGLLLWGNLEEHIAGQVPLREIENKTKLDFGKLRQFDPLENDTNESFMESGTSAVPIRKLESIIM